MTEDYKPTDNAVAERINGIIKAESSILEAGFNDIRHARNVARSHTFSITIADRI